MRYIGGFFVGLLTLVVATVVPLAALMLIGYIGFWITGIPTDKSPTPMSIIYPLVGLVIVLGVILIGYLFYRIAVFGNHILKETSPYGEDDTRYNRKIPL